MDGLNTFELQSKATVHRPPFSTPPINQISNPQPLPMPDQKQKCPLRKAKAQLQIAPYGLWGVPLSQGQMRRRDSPLFTMCSAVVGLHSPYFKARPGTEKTQKEGSNNTSSIICATRNLIRIYFSGESHFIGQQSLWDKLHCSTVGSIRNYQA